MKNHLMSDGIGGEGIPIGVFAARLGVSLRCLYRLCKRGQVFGARKHPLTKKWWIYPPAKLLCSVNPKRQHANGSTLKASGLAECEQV